MVMKMNKREFICYNSDSSRIIGKAENVVFPKSIDEVQYIIRSSPEDLVPRGSGCGLCAGSVPEDSIVIDLGKLNKVTDFNPIKKSVHVDSGVTIKELNEKLNSIGFEFPIYFSDELMSTIGSMIATNSPGEHSLKYGTVKDWIEDITFVNGKGEVIKTTKADLMDVCGMEGTTGVIVSATLKILPLLKRTASVFQTDNIEDLFLFLRRLKNEQDVVMIQFFSKSMSGILSLPKKYNVIIEFDSDRGKIKGDDYLDLVKIKSRTFYSLYKEGYIKSEDPKLFSDKLKEFMLYLENNNTPYFGYYGTGTIFAFFKDNEKLKHKDTLDLLLKMKSKIGRYGVGKLKKEFIDSFELKVIERVKLRHDPLLKFNYGKLITLEQKVKRADIRHEEKITKFPSEIIPLLGEEKSANDLIKNVTSDNNKDKINENVSFKPKTEQKQSLNHSQEITKTRDKIPIIESKILINQAKEKEINILEIRKELEKKSLDPSILATEIYPEAPRIGHKNNPIQKPITPPIKPTHNIGKNVYEQSQFKPSTKDSQEIKENKNKNLDYRSIQDIMTNKFPGPNSLNKTEKSEINKNNETKNNSQEINKNNSNNLNNTKETKFDNDEKDLINSIMNNKFKK